MSHLIKVEYGHDRQIPVIDEQNILIRKKVLATGERIPYPCVRADTFSARRTQRASFAMFVALVLLAMLAMLIIFGWCCGTALPGHVPEPAPIFRSRKFHRNTFFQKYCSRSKTQNKFWFMPDLSTPRGFRDRAVPCFLECSEKLKLTILGFLSTLMFQYSLFSW